MTTTPGRLKNPLTAALAQAIRDRAYRPGEWLRQIDLEARFSAKRFDIRRALDELAVLKLIEHVPNRGYRVAVVDEATYRAIREARIIAETGAAAGIVAGADGATLAELRRLAADFRAAVDGGTREQQSRINHAFHRSMYACCGNPVLEEMIWALRDRARGGSELTVWSSHRARLVSAADHDAMVEAIGRRDAGRLGQLIARHIAKDAAAVKGDAAVRSDAGPGAARPGGRPPQSSTETSQARGSEVSDAV